jgi:hypothetical protein
MNEYNPEKYFKTWNDMFDRTLKDTKQTFSYLEDRLKPKEAELLQQKLNEDPFSYGERSYACNPSEFLEILKKRVYNHSEGSFDTEECWKRFGGVSTKYTETASLACQVLNHYSTIFNALNSEGSSMNLEKLDEFSKVASDSFEGLSLVLRQGYHMRLNLPSFIISTKDPDTEYRDSKGSSIKLL